MEIGDQSAFCLEELYGEEVDDIIEILNVHPDDFGKVNEGSFKNVVYSHIERMWMTKKMKLPSFGKGFEWLNTSRPLSFDDLQNKVYVIDFFTYCCINCIHILPLLKKVESEYANYHEFAVIGIHSPKFPNEKDLERVKEALIRNDIKHPVLNDSESKLWKKYGISCWPTVFIVGPAHTLLFVLVGETQINKLSFLCHHVLEYLKSHEVELDLCSIPALQMKEIELKKSGLLFPGNISTNGDHVIVSDTGHNQLLLMTKALKLEEIIGSGFVGSDDGPFNSASFNSPHGTTWYNDVLYVADTGNHSIRKIDFKNKIVSTVFKSDDYADDISDQFVIKISFQSPWDVCIGPKLDSDLTSLNVLYIAVAGSHQIWELDLKADLSRPGVSLCIPFAGSGKEENRQNHYRFKAGFAQPSGITYSSLIPGYLFVADSESSTIKSIALKKGHVHTIVGGGINPLDLFQFGDQDGKYVQAKLQHPMSVCVFKDNFLAITDTYNHKIKFVDVKERECVTFKADVDLCEPSGICVVDDELLVADTNNHRIVPISIYDGKIPEVTPVEFDEVMETLNLPPHYPPATTVPLRYGGKIFCHFNLFETSRYEFNMQAGQKWDVSFRGDGKLYTICNSNNLFGCVQPSVVLKSSCGVKECSNESQTSEVTFSVILSLCDKKMKICCSKEITFKMLINFSNSGFNLVCMNFNTVID